MKMAKILLFCVVCALSYVEDRDNKDGLYRCEPTTIIAVSAMALAAGGTAMTVMGQRAQAKQESKIADYNAMLAKNEAKEAEKAGRAEMEMHRRRANQILSSQKAAFGKQGTAMEGSPLMVLADTESQLNLENATIKRNAVLGQNRYTQQSNIFGMQSKGAKQAGRYAAAGSLLMGASQTVGTGYDTGLLKKAN